MTLTGLLRRAGGLGKRVAWDLEFKRGAAFVGDRAPTMRAMMHKYGDGQDVVELACGDGSLARDEAAREFRSYEGYDVSLEAVNLARETATDTQTFGVRTMEAWKPTSPFGLLVIEEAIYYLSPKNQARLFAKAFEAARDAIVLVVVHSADKHRESLELCRSVATVVEEIVVKGERTYLVLKRSEQTA